MKFIKFVLLFVILACAFSIKIKSKNSKTKQNYNGSPSNIANGHNSSSQEPVVYFGYPLQTEAPKNYNNNQKYSTMNRREFNNALEEAKSQMDHPIQITNVI